MTETHDCPYCEESFDSKQGVNIHKGYNHDLPYKDEETMRRLYVDEQRSIAEIADKFDAGSTTIEKWLDKHGIDKRDFGGKPDDAAYKDPEKIRELYIDKDLSRREVAGRLDCSVGDVRYHMEKHGIEKQPEPWHDPETLREKCEEEHIPVPELAERWDCGETTLYYHLDKHGIDSPKNARANKRYTVPYSQIYHREDGQNHFMYVHRLVAYAHRMIDGEELFNSEMDIHHKDGCEWVNSPDNLQVVTPEKHQDIHSETSIN